MNKLPNAVKWLIVLAVLGAMGALMWKVNDRASREVGGQAVLGRQH